MPALPLWKTATIASGAPQRYLCILHGQGRQAQVHPLPALTVTLQTALCRRTGDERHLRKGKPHHRKEGRPVPCRRLTAGCATTPTRPPRCSWTWAGTAATIGTNRMMNNSLQFGLSDEFTGETLKDFIGRLYPPRPYHLHGQRRLKVPKLAWTPIRQS